MNSLSSIHEKKDGKINFAFIFFSLSFSLIFFISCFVLCITFLQHEFTINSDTISDVNDNEELENYQYLLFDPQSKKSIFGNIRSGSNELRKGVVYDTNEDDEGRIHMTSLLGTQEYQCSGSCFCDDDEYDTEVVIEEVERRIIGQQQVNILRKGIIFLVAGFSTLLAIKEAEEHLQNECSEEFNGLCDHETSIIRSEIQYCRSVYDDDDIIIPFERNIEKDIINREEEEEEEVSVGDDESMSFSMFDGLIVNDESEIRKYWCHGNCLKKQDFRLPESEELADDLGCESLQTQGDIYFREDEIVKYKYFESSSSSLQQQQQQKENLNDDDDDKVIEIPKRKFQDDFLVPFCTKHGKRRYLYENPDLGLREWIDTQLCVPFHRDFSNKRGGLFPLNPSIRCRRIS